MSFNSLKKKRSNIADLAAKLESQGKRKYESDDRFWYPKRDEKGNGYAVIRFLPPPDGEDASYVQTFRHGYKGKNGWYIEDCPTTIDKKCPVCAANSALYDELGTEAASRIVSGQNGRKRKMSYISNIYIVSDPETPENEGKVMLFKYGAKIFEKIKMAVSPEFEDETAIDPFDMWEGANFKMKIRKVDGNVNYDSSIFAEPSQLLETDKELEAVYSAEHSLAEFVSENTFKSYEDLEKRFNQIEGIEDAGKTASAPAQRSAEPAKTAPPEATEAVTPELISQEDEDTLDFFQDLAEKG